MRAILELAAEKEVQRSGGKHVDLNAVCDSAAEKIARAQMPTERVFFYPREFSGTSGGSGYRPRAVLVRTVSARAFQRRVAHAINNMP